jgi:hypothetical protein
VQHENIKLKWTLSIVIWFQECLHGTMCVSIAIGSDQGGQIGRIFWENFTLCCGLKIIEVNHISGLLFSTVQVMHVLILSRGATFWATFSQTHLVTLVLTMLALPSFSMKMLSG